MDSNLNQPPSKDNKDKDKPLNNKPEHSQIKSLPHYLITDFMLFRRTTGVRESSEYSETKCLDPMKSFSSPKRGS
jgi:hypothetical protein